MSNPRFHHTVIVAESVLFKGQYTIGPHTIIGLSNGELVGNCIIGNNATIGSFCVLENDLLIGSNCYVDHYCAIYSKVKIGENVRLLYGAKVFSEAQIGNNCIVSGDIPERVILEDDVTFMGVIAHSYRNPTIDWDEATEDSPIIKKGSVIGVNALIVGGITVGSNCYIAAGEVLRHSLPDNSVYMNGKVISIDFFRGFIKTRIKQ
jgi:acetyltransferase-like isoleucine patch superfamily enzyme